MDKKKRPLQILTIDDETQIQFALKAVFQSQGWEMISAKDAEEGIEKFRAFRPDLVLIDYHLPKVNGIKVVERLHKEDPNVPLIVFTIEDNQEVANQFLAAGASDFILKPVKALDLISRVKLHIRIVESQREQRQSAEEAVKGIGQSTLNLIETYLGNTREFQSVESIAEGTGLAYQTTYRYLQYLVSINRVEVCQKYGKVGRPKQRYRMVLADEREDMR